MYRIGVDIGGTNIKIGVVDENGSIIAKKSVSTESDKGAEHIISKIAKVVCELSAECGLNTENTLGIGVGCPGMIDGDDGVVVYANNLNWRNVQFAAALIEKTSFKVCVGNDANAAALGEYLYGAGKDYHSTVMVTLGTGVGGGIVIDGKLLAGFKGAGAEIGHTLLVEDGEPCSCGRRGCFEAYASATALIRDTKRAMLKNKKSLLWEVAKNDIENVGGRTVFDAAKKSDETALAVIDTYTKHLAEGIVNLANILRPQAVIIGGGVSASGEKFLSRLQQFVNDNIYGGVETAPCTVLVATLGNDAGIIGAAALVD